MPSHPAEGVRVVQLSQDERSHYGCIVQFDNEQARWFPGADGLKDAIAYADAHKLKICVISKPETIYRDLQGTRARFDVPSGKRMESVYFPEYQMLGFAGRDDLIANDRRNQDSLRRKRAKQAARKADS